MQQTKCRCCNRRLREGLFVHNSIVCNACIRKKEKVGEMRQRGGGLRTSVNHSFITQDIPGSENATDPLAFLRSNAAEISSILRDALDIHSNIRYYISLEIKYKRISDDGVAWITSNFCSTPFILYRADFIDDQLDRAVSTITTRAENFEELGSGWSIDEIKTLRTHIASYNPTGGSSYIPTPKRIAGRQAIINVKNDDDKCFLFSILAYLHPASDNTDKPRKYLPFMKELNVTGLNFPLRVQDVVKFESLNPSISVNVLHIDERQTIVPLQVTEHRNRKHQINLLLITQSYKIDANGKEIPCDEKSGTIFRSHYTLIKNLSRLFSSQSNHNGRIFVCPYCLHRFFKEYCLQRHLPDCGTNKPCVITFPSNKVKPKKKSIDEREEDIETIEEHMGIDADLKSDDLPENVLTFNQEQNSFPVLFALYIDFESFMVKDMSDVNIDHHEPSGFACLRVSAMPEHNNNEVYVYSGPDVMEHFFEHIKKEHKEINKILDKNESMLPLDDEQKEEYYSAKRCNNCNKDFSSINWKVRHHCHLTGRFIAATCNNCNLKFKFKKSGTLSEKKFFLPVIAHNMKGYDGHLIIKHLQKKHVDHEEINVIASNTEKFLAFSIGQLRFLDSLQFLNGSLDTLVNVIAKDDVAKFKHTRRHFNSDNLFKLGIRKGVYPYEYMSDSSKFEDKTLPPIENFFSRLYDEGISQDDYERAKEVWREFGITNMREYHDLYLKTDVLLLADVFENFRNVAMENYALDAAHFYTTPGLSFAACLKQTGVKLELFTNPDQLLFIEKGIRGGISTISNRYSKANNKYLPSFNPDEPSKYILYLDANNLYGYAMSESMPTGGFKWMSRKEISEFNLSKVGPDDDIGYILEVDLEYPAHLHNMHSDYPLAPESFPVSTDILSEYSKELLERLGKTAPSKINKLIPNLHDKKNYVVHSQNLQFYVKMGMHVTKIHRVLQFNQSQWLADYINFNTEKRKMATSTFEKDFYKLLNNSMFGKSIEQLRNRSDIRLVSGEAQAERFIARPSFDCFRIINEDITMIKLTKTKIHWNKPSYLGFCVLELSKLLMYKFHYEHIIPKYGRNAKLLFTDTDSLCYEICTDDVYSDMMNDSHLFDTSDYPTSHQLYSSTNAKVIGKFKDECNGKPPLEFVGLRSKMYSIKMSESTSKSTAKGVKRSFAKKHLKHSLYKDCLFDEKRSSASFCAIRSSNHSISTKKICKDALSPYDDKRYLQSGTTDTLAYGHWRIYKN